jgi:uncharacterized protein
MEPRSPLGLTGRRRAVLTTAAGIALLLCTSLFPTPGYAQTPTVVPPGTPLPRTVTVSGVGRVSAPPDVAVIVTGVQTQAKQASDALTQNSQAMTALINALKTAGIAPDDIQTQSLDLQPQFQEPTQSNGTRTLIGYIATNTVQVRVRDISKLGAALDTAVKSGGNLIQGIQFEIGNPDPLLTQARDQAMKDARQKADQLAKLAGAQLGSVQTITETSGQPPVPMPFSASAAKDLAVPIQQGTQNVEVDVQVVWTLVTSP